MPLRAWRQNRTDFATSDPCVVLAAAASATTRIGLGTYVLNAGIREPWQVASAVATLDALSGGRMHLGLGAGHVPAEWRGRS